MVKILVIEDNAIIRLSIIHFLKSQGFEVIQASNGQSGLQLIIESHPDLILCDINLPGIDGYTILETLRLYKTLTQTRFIFFSSDTHPENYRRAMRLGANDFLSKSVGETELMDAIHYQINPKTCQELPA